MSGRLKEIRERFRSARTGPWEDLSVSLDTEDLRYLLDLVERMAGALRDGIGTHGEPCTARDSCPFVVAARSLLREVGGG